MPVTETATFSLRGYYDLLFSFFFAYFEKVVKVAVWRRTPPSRNRHLLASARCWHESPLAAFPFVDPMPRRIVTAGAPGKGVWQAREEAEGEHSLIDWPAIIAWLLSTAFAIGKGGP